MYKKTNKVNRFNAFIIVFFILHSLSFFNFKSYVQIGDNLYFVDTLFFIYFTFLSINKKNRNNKKAKPLNAMILMFVLFLTSIFVGYFQGGQTLYYGFKGIVHSFLYISFFFYLKTKKIPIFFIKKVIFLTTFLYLVVVILSYIQFPNCWFGYRSWIEDYTQVIQQSKESRGVYRFDIPGADFLTITMFYIVTNKLKNNKAILFIVLLVFQLLRGARFPIIITLLLSLLGYMYSKKISFKRINSVAIMIFLVYTLLMSVNFTRNVIDRYTMLSTEQIEANTNESDIRLQSFSFYSTVFNGNNVLAIAFGNGIPLKGNVKDKIDAAHNSGFYISDIEYIQWYIYFGLIGLVILFYWAISCLKAKINRENTYLKIFILYLLLVMCLGSHFWLNLPLISMVCYILYYNNLSISINKDVH